MSPAISVIVPAFNVEPYIGAAIQSVLDQTRGDFELIVVDDGSTDATARVVAGFSDPRLRLIGRENGGPAAARNSGVAVAAGRYIAFLDADDTWVREKLERQAATLDREPGVDLVFGVARVVAADGSAAAGRALFGRPGRHTFESMLIEDVVANGSSQMIRRDAWDDTGGFDPAMRVSEDHDLWLRIALLREGNVFGDAQVVTDYRRRPGQLTADWRRTERFWEALLRKMRRLAPERTAAVEAKASANMYRVLSSIAYENGEYGDAQRLLRQAFRLHTGYLAADSRTWLQGLAVAAAATLPKGLHGRLDSAARRMRNRLA